MSRPPYCQICRVLVPTDVSMVRRGAFWICETCAPMPPFPVCPEFQHDYAGAVEDQGSTFGQGQTIWCCRVCGARLLHQIIGTKPVEAAQEPGDIDC